MNGALAAGRSAGVLVPLFSLRSSESWGIGEIGDIPATAAWLASAHQSILQLLPVNELAPGETSPYSSLSAMAIDPQFISLRLLEDFSALGGEQALDERSTRALAAARARRRVVDYQTVRDVKMRALRRSFERFHEFEWSRDTPRAKGLRAFIASESWWLDDYSLYRAISAERGDRGWTSWEEPLRRRDPAALESAKRDLAIQILFRQYLQWVADGQWRDARRAADPVGLFGDFPFMVTADSPDVWARQEEFRLDASIGTPPDAFSETGQNWGLPPYRWDVMARNGYQWLQQRVRRSRALYAGFRVDHVVGFYRTFIRPLDGSDPFFEPAEEVDQVALGEHLMSIFAADGARVTAEDLGTVPPYVRRSLAERGIPGCRVLRWERQWNVEGRPFVDPADYPALSVATTGTHDTETMALWWRSMPEPDRVAVGEVRSLRAAAGDRIDWASERLTTSMLDAVLQALYQSPSTLVLLPIQDIFGWGARINRPAAISIRNWTYLLPWPVERLTFEAEPVARAKALAEWADRFSRWIPRGT
jgi:4-alpha-glucanotransferase